MTLIDLPNDTRHPVELYEVESFYSRFVFSPDGTRAAFGYANGNVELWDIPPSRSYSAPIFATVPLAVLVLLSLVLRRRKANGTTSDDIHAGDESVYRPPGRIGILMEGLEAAL